MNFTDEWLTTVHGHSINNRPEIESSVRCACFCCLQEFKPSDIKTWVTRFTADSKGTAICPLCSVDSVLGDYQVDLTNELLQDLKTAYFETSVKMNGYPEDNLPT